MVLGCGGGIKNLQLGRKLLRDWGFRRAEDIVWLQKKKATTSPNPFFKSTKEHFLVGIKGTIRRNVDGHFINSNLDTDIIVTDTE